MKKFAELLSEDRRLVILQLIQEAGGSANESVLRQGLEQTGNTAELTYHKVRDELRFLEEAGCVRLSWYGDKIAVAHITKRGVDCVAGQIKIEGVKKPSLGL
jgi:predicted transcriptional regulator